MNSSTHAFLTSSSLCVCRANHVRGSSSSVSWLLLIKDAELAAAVSNAGGLGIITALTVASPPNGPEQLREEIKKCKALTSKPCKVSAPPCLAMVLQ